MGSGETVGPLTWNKLQQSAPGENPAPSRSAQGEPRLGFCSERIKTQPGLYYALSPFRSLVVF